MHVNEVFYCQKCFIVFVCMLLKQKGKQMMDGMHLTSTIGMKFNLLKYSCKLKLETMPRT